MHSSFLSDLKKTTVVVESLSSTSTRCSVTEITNLLQDWINRMRNLHQIYLWSKNWLDILPVFPSLSQANLYLYVFFVELFLIFYMLACFSKTFCTSLPIFTRFSTYFGSWNNDLSDLWYVLDIIPSWYG